MPKQRRKQVQSRPGILDGDIHIEEERRRTYLGSARVDLETLKFDREPQNQLDPQNVQRLLAVFENGGCLRLPSQHHVPAVIDGQSLHDAMVRSGLSAENLLQPDLSHCPLLLFPDGVRVNCLHGRHRIAAAKQHLHIVEQWWIVDFYASDLSSTLRANLMQQNSNERPPNVGEVFFRILGCDPTDRSSLGFWWSQIHSANEVDELRHLTKRPSLSQAFREVARFLAFGRQLLPGKIGGILRLKCDEEVIHGLRHVPKTWLKIFSGVTEAEHRLDPQTVEAVQLKSVKHCGSDRESLEPLVRRGVVFGNFLSYERHIIWRNLLALSGRIPSLEVFFEDLKHLEDLGECVKPLFQLPRGQTLSQTMQQSFVSQHGQSHSREDQYNLARRRLFLFTMQNLQNLRPLSIMLGDDTKRRVEEAIPLAWYELAQEASRLGFRSVRIDEYLAKDPDRLEAKRSLLRARNPAGFTYDAKHFESAIDVMVKLYAKARKIVSDLGSVVYVTDDDDVQGAKYLDGRPSQYDFIASAPFLTLENMHIDTEFGVGRLTSLFVRRDFYLSFFGELERPLDAFQPANTSTSGDGDAQQENADQAPSDSDWEMEILDSTEGVADDAMVLVQSPLSERDSPSQYSQSVDDDLIINATNRVIGAGMESSPTQETGETAEWTSRPQITSSDAIRTTEVPNIRRSTNDITLVVHQEKDIQTSESIQIDGRSSSALKEVISGYIDRGIYPFDTTFRILALEQCFDAALADVDRTLFLMPKLNMTVSTTQMLEQGLRKRPASEEIHARPHKRAMIKN